MTTVSAPAIAGSTPNAFEPIAPLDPQAVLSPFKVEEWRRLTPADRLERAWALRNRLSDPRDVHDRKLFPAP